MNAGVGPPLQRQRMAYWAEVQKVLVLRSERGQGMGRALMEAMEAVEREAGRTLLVLDTRQVARRTGCIGGWDTSRRGWSRAMRAARRGRWTRACSSIRNVGWMR